MSTLFPREALDELMATTRLFLPRFAAGVIVLLVFWLAAALLRRLIHRLGGKTPIDVDVLNLVERVAMLTVLTVGVITACGTLGIDVAALVTGLGLTGFAVGFALKEIISNLLAGVLLLVYEPFRRNDRIRVTDLEGTVVAIDLRYTTLAAEDRVILIPNANLLTNAVIVHRAAR